MAQKELPSIARSLTLGALVGVVLALAHAAVVGMQQSQTNAANGGEGQGAVGTAVFFAIYEVPVGLALGLLVARVGCAVARTRRSRTPPRSGIAHGTAESSPRQG